MWASAKIDLGIWSPTRTWISEGFRIKSINCQGFWVREDAVSNSSASQQQQRDYFFSNANRSINILKEKISKNGNSVNDNYRKQRPKFVSLLHAKWTLFVDGMGVKEKRAP